MVVRHTVEVCGIKMEVEGFSGTVINEYVNKDGIPYVNLYGEGSKSGNRVVPKEFVFFEDENAKGLAFDGESYIIKCCECGEPRKVKSQHANQVTRCKDCQNKRNILMARSRARKRYRDEKGTV
jgi:hypothetical protein